MQGPFDDLQFETCAGGVVGGDGALIASVGEEAEQPGEPALDPKTDFRSLIADVPSSANSFVTTEVMVLSGVMP